MAEEDKKDSSVSDAFKNALMYFGPKVAAYFIGKGGGGNVEGGLNALKMQGEMDEGFRRFQQSRQPAQRKGLTEYQRASLYMRAQEEASQRKRAKQALEDQKYDRQTKMIENREQWEKRLNQDPGVKEGQEVVRASRQLQHLMEGEPNNFKDGMAIRRVLKMSGEKRFSREDYESIMGSQTYGNKLYRWANKGFGEGTEFHGEDREILHKFAVEMEKREIENLRNWVTREANEREKYTGGREKAAHTLEWAMPQVVLGYDARMRGVETPQSKTSKINTDPDMTVLKTLQGGGSLTPSLQEAINKYPDKFSKTIEFLKLKQLGGGK